MPIARTKKVAEKSDKVPLLTGPWIWTNNREKAALLISQGNKTSDEIAKLCNVTYQGLYKWQRDPDFKARVAEHNERFHNAVMNQGIAMKTHRIHALNHRHGLMNKVIEERGEDMSEIPGGKTGLLVRQLKGIGKGKDFREVEEYAVDTGLLKELREHERQAAIETGTWDHQADKLPGNSISNKIEIEISYVDKPPMELEDAIDVTPVKKINGQVNGKVNGKVNGHS